ncbi:MAG: hypothetical protein F9K24_00820 [Leptonema illini]|jgi:hypothetical protein|uniref:Uncharacterized protein n=2 Tax=Leptonema illini TaxID=183 RepID=H2CG36_9LEPT|nr:hypothetical protein [Leptonema illini]EHQ07884.1 hypothetical protein Lepil_3222 [Leptonema illini DSM 21528]KAB2935302.1 MAG: hypothetical protein F9K24_00820 [Leptonema illini]
MANSIIRKAKSAQKGSAGENLELPLPAELRHNIFREVTGSDKVPSSTIEAWEILTRNSKIKVQGKPYGNKLVIQEGSVFNHRRYSDDIEKEIDTALKL